jgi:amino acid transporter
LLLTVAVLLLVGGNLAGGMVTAPRLTYALAREGSLPAWLGRVHPATRTPANSILLYSLLVFLLAVYGSFVWLAAMSALVRVLIYMACIGAMPRLRRRFGDTPGSFRVPGGWFTGLGAFLVSGLLLLQVRAEAVLVTAGFMLAGALVYAWARLGGRTPGDDPETSPGPACGIVTHKRARLYYACICIGIFGLILALCAAKINYPQRQLPTRMHVDN